jgi:uncharacterized damage-inducible protein DinB
MLFLVTNTQLLLALLDEAYDRQSWHGTNLRGSIRGLSADQAEWRPASRRHSIREIAIHAAYWKYAVRRRLVGDKRGSFPVKGSNWFAADPARSWAADVALLAGEHKALRAVVAALQDATLDRPLLKNGRTVAFLVRGIAAHDLYHAGQIQLLKRLQRAR